MMKNKRFLSIILAIPIFLLIPLIAMQFTNEVNWTLSDFVIAFMLLFLVASALELVLRLVKSRKSRFIFLLIILLLFVLVWGELAVGILGSPFAGN